MNCLLSRVRKPSLSRLYYKNFSLNIKLKYFAALRSKEKLSMYDKVSLSLPIHLVSGTFIVTYMISRNPEVMYLMYPSNSFWKLRWVYLSLVITAYWATHFVLSFIVFASFIILTFLHNCKKWTEERIWSLKRQDTFCPYFE